MYILHEHGKAPTVLKTKRYDLRPNYTPVKNYCRRDNTREKVNEEQRVSCKHQPSNNTIRLKHIVIRDPSDRRSRTFH